ncbi:hypothetical protein Vadar_003282 [Vaccinium darrowii]|uniref:Uncharacterized protein n=1 Tax=Vaccinium darrowii TaxID=229202 RepID=A0ACB7X7N6_9ERIC|nr:hypothetical protein Vadar_003282 [Vaccinium darrowii]
MSTSKVPPTSHDANPSINNSSSRSKARARCFIELIKAKVSKPQSKPLGHNDHSTASSSEITTRSNNNNNSGPLALPNMICQDLVFMKEASAKIKKYVEDLDMQINRACEKLQDLQTRENSEMELDELKMAVKKLKSKIPSQLKMHSRDSKPHQNRWPNVNKASDEMMRKLYEQQKFEPAIDPKGLLEAFLALPPELRRYMMCFFWFPPRAIITRRVMIYLWMAHPYGIKNINEERANVIFDKLIAKGFIEPVTQKCSLVANCCMMSHSLRSSLTREICQQNSCYLVDSSSNQFLAVGFDDSDFKNCLINSGAAIIDDWPEEFEKTRNLKILYLGRWQTSSMHHIEFADTKFLNRLKITTQLTFLSLRGISLITELPSFIKECTLLKILDLRACHNLEVIPDWIGSLNKLTHLDMSECYLLQHMPKSLAKLSNLEVLKGFFLQDLNNDEETCALVDLSKLLKLRKLNVNTNSVNFIAMECCRGFTGLQKLTISWAGSRTPEASSNNRLLGFEFLFDYPPFSRKLQKLVLRGFRETRLPFGVPFMWELNKLYIRGGNVCSLQSIDDWQRWNGVKVLHLKYLSELRMDWGELMSLFPNLVYLHKVECPMLTDFPCDENGVWMDKMAIDTDQASGLYRESRAKLSRPFSAKFKNRSQITQRISAKQPKIRSI